MGAILKGIQSVLIALGIIAIIGTGVILYYNTVTPPEEVASVSETETEESDTPPSDSAEETKAPETEESALTTGDTASSVFSAENGHEHTYTATILRPSTCTEPGEVKYTCYCGDSYVDAIQVLEHKPGQWLTVRSATSAQTGLRQRSCIVCGRVLEEEVLPMLPANESSSDSKKKPAANDHKHTYTYEITEEAACTEKGEKTYTCTICGSTFKTAIPATNHPSRRTVRTEGNCSDPGKIETICNLCDAVISSEELKYDHNWGSWVTTTAATTSAAGEQTRTCKRCNTTETRSIARLPGGSSGTGNTGSSGNNSGNGTGNNNGTGGSTDTTTPCSHTYTSRITNPANCTQPGTTVYTCSKCGNTYTEALPAALGHALGSWIVDTPATSTAEGKRIQMCNRCGETVNTETIAKLPETHKCTYNKMEIIKEPTSTQSGTKKYTCSICGKYYTATIPKLP